LTLTNAKMIHAGTVLPVRISVAVMNVNVYLAMNQMAMENVRI
jgi:hypothetical protein